MAWLRGCPFCAIAAGDAPAAMIREWDDTVAFVPLNPVTPGHVLVVPREHAEDFTSNLGITATTMFRAAELVRELAPDGDFNLITSKGPDATQTVNHLHVHVVPRYAFDGLHLPWTDQPRLQRPLPTAADGHPLNAAGRDPREPMNPWPRRA